MPHRTLNWENKSGCTIFAQIWSPETNPEHVVLLIHGLGEHSGRYAEWAKRFVNQGIAVYALDLHGHGRSTGARGHVTAFEYIYDDIQHLLGVATKDHPKAKLHLHGHSMGAAVSLGFVTPRPSSPGFSNLTSIVTTGAAIRPGFEPPAWKLKLAALLNKVVPWLALGNELDPKWISSDPRVVAAYLADPLVHDRISVRWYNEWVRTIEDVRVNRDGIKTPLFMLHGAADKATSPKASEEMAKLLKAKFQLLPGAFHELHHEPCQNEVFAQVLDWILSR
jgi:alpha-beta hydrolase superfamily lysophospholipase